MTTSSPGPEKGAGDEGALASDAADALHGAGQADLPRERSAPPTSETSLRAPAVAEHIFGDRLGLAERYAGCLADTGAAHGLIGPREVPRLWERHLLNCAVMHDAIPHGVSVIDVGSGAGLPGLVLAIVRPDLRLHLVEPMLRRTTWLENTIRELELPNVTVHRGRAEQLWGELVGPVVTARAVAPLAELARWCLPLVDAGGVMLALKGSSAPEELARDRDAVRRLGSVEESVDTYGDGLLDPVTTVVRLRVDQPVQPHQAVRSGAGGRTGARGRRSSRRPRR